jgi:hypothetical protein
MTTKFMRLFRGDQHPYHQRQRITHDHSNAVQYDVGRNRPKRNHCFFAPPFYSHSFALVVLFFFVRSISATCILADRPWASYSFSACYSSCTSTGVYSAIKLDSTNAWQTPVRFAKKKKTPPPNLVNCALSDNMFLDLRDFE